MHQWVVAVWLELLIVVDDVDDITLATTYWTTKRPQSQRALNYKLPATLAIYAVFEKDDWHKGVI